MSSVQTAKQAMGWIQQIYPKTQKSSNMAKSIKKDNSKYIQNTIYSYLQL